MAGQAQGPDPRFGFFAPVRASSYTTPLGRRMDFSQSRSVVLSNPDDPFSPITSASATMTMNGRLSASFFEAATRTITNTSPSGRTSVSTIDATGRLIRTDVPGIAAVEYAYDSRGLLETVTQGTRMTSLGYDAKQRLTSITDPIERTVHFDYDDADRVTKQILADGREVAFSYDAAGNLVSLTPPGRAPHQFAPTPVNLEQSYVPPAVPNGGSTEYVYNRDRQLTRVLRAGGSSIDLSYDGAGRLSTMTTGRGEYSFGYDAFTGTVRSITTPEGQALSYEYDGDLLPSVTLDDGGRVSWNYDEDFAVQSETVCDAQWTNCTSADLTYDDDKLLQSIGELSLTRDAANGLLTTATVNGITDSWSHNSFGEPLTYESRFGSSALFREELTRDDGGRITAKRVILGATTTDWTYGYDAAGRLVDVTIDGTATAHYEYDSNGNRLSRTTPSGTDAASCDGQDRMTSYGTATYAYAPNGELESATDASGTTQTIYDEIGNLVQVRLPDARVIDYVIDGQNHRVGRKVDGTVTHRWLYSGQLRVVAEIDAAGSIVSRFVYGTRSNIPDYMVRSGITYRFITDHLGSPRLVVDAQSGAIMQQLEYDEFGKVLADTNPGFQPFGFAGGLYDLDTGFVRFGARDYDPHVGRWTAKDPIGFSSGDANLYSYVASDPVNYGDPTGLDRYVLIVGDPGLGAHNVGNLFSALPTPTPAPCVELVIPLTSSARRALRSLVRRCFLAHRSRVPFTILVIVATIVFMLAKVRALGRTSIFPMPARCRGETSDPTPRFI